VKLARSCGFDCLVYDHRSHFIENFEREFDETVWHRHPETWQISESDHDGIWVIMSHNFEIDRCLLEKIPMARAKYVGILGSKDRFAELKDSFCKKSPAIDWTVVRAPIGLPLGGREPADIALATLAEIQAVLHKTSPEVG
jgi:xanthine dehydrogenase accessory factor